MRTPVNETSAPAIEAIVGALSESQPPILFGLGRREVARPLDGVMEGLRTKDNFAIAREDVPYLDTNMIDDYHYRKAPFLTDLSTSAAAIAQRRTFVYQEPSGVYYNLNSADVTPDMVMRIAVAYASEGEIGRMFEAQDAFMEGVDAMIETTPVAKPQRYTAIFGRFRPWFEEIEARPEWQEKHDSIVSARALLAYAGHQEEHRAMEEHKPLAAFIESAYRAGRDFRIHTAADFYNAVSKVMWDDYRLDTRPNAVKDIYEHGGISSLSAMDAFHIARLWPNVGVSPRLGSREPAIMPTHRVRVPNRLNEVYAEETGTRPRASSVTGSPYERQPGGDRDRFAFRKNFD